MAVLAEFDGVGREMRFADLALDRRAVDAGNAVTRAGEFGAVTIVEIDDAPRDLDQRRGIRRGVMPVLGQAEQERRPLARHDDALGFGLAQRGDGISALQLRDRRAHGGEEIGLAAQFESNQVRDDFGVGIRGKHITRLLQADTQFLVIFDDPVMHYRQSVGNVRVRIALARHAMRCPAGMSDAGRPGGMCLVNLRRQFGDPPNGTQAPQPGGIDQRQTG